MNGSASCLRSVDRRRAGVRDHGISVDGARDPVVDRGHRPATRSRPRERWAARGCGCSRRSRCRLPLPGIITGNAAGRSRAGLGEFGATITFVSNIPGETQTLPLAIYTFTQVPGGDAGPCA